MFNLLLVPILWLLMLGEFPPETGLRVKIVGIKSNRGTIILGVFKNDGTFPTIGRQYKGYEIEIEDKKANILIKDLPKGKYAIGVLHDLNSNKKMDKSTLGKPLEPYGISNNVRGFLSYPTFDQSSFIYNGNLNLEIKVE